MRGEKNRPTAVAVGASVLDTRWQIPLHNADPEKDISILHQSEFRKGL